MRPLCLALLLLGWPPPGRAAEAPKTIYRMETIAGCSDMGDGGPAVAAQMGNIQGVATDRFGNVYLSDTDRHRVRKIAPGGIITTLAGAGTAGFSGDGGPALLAQLSRPWGLAADANGNVYVADFDNHRVRRIGTDGTITTVAGNGEKGSAGDGGPAVAAQLLTPRNLALDSAGNLYIAEFEGHRIRKVFPDGRIATAVGIGIAGFRGDGGAAINAQLQYPDGLAVDRAGALYIADSQNLRVRKVSPPGIIDTVLGGTAATAFRQALTAVAVDSAGTIYAGDQSATVHAYTTAGAWITAANVMANDLAVDAGGSLYVAEYMHVARINANGTLQNVAGDGYLHVGDGGAALAAQLYAPSALALDTPGNLYIADSGTARIRRVSAGQIVTIAGTGVAGYSGENVAAGLAQLKTPMGIALDAFGNIIIADTNNNRIRQIGGDGRIRTIAGTGVAGVGQEGLPGTQTPLNGPQAVCAGRAGAVYVVDTSNNRVLRFLSGMSVLTAAGNGSPGDVGDGGPGRLAELNSPAACAVDTAGNLYIADKMNHRIRKITASGVISTIAGTGAWGFAGDGGPAIFATLNLPGGIAVDDVNVYIADTANNRIRQITPDGVIQTIAGGEGKQLSGPRGLLLDGSGNLYFADAGNNLVRKLAPMAAEPAGPAATPGALSVVNAASLAAGPVAPGEVISIFGEGLGAPIGSAAGFDASGSLPHSVNGTEVLFNGMPAPILFAHATQVNAQAPYTIAGSAATRIEVRYQGEPAGAATLPVTDAAPALFPLVTNQDGSYNSAAAPAPRNSIITLYGTGEGLTDGPNVAGQSAVAPYPQARLAPALTVGGIPAEILWAGSAPGQAGIFQINARLPGGFLASGRSTLVWTAGTTASAPVAVWVE